MRAATRAFRHALGYLALRGLLAVGRVLPLAVLRRLRTALAPIAMRLARRDCRIARQNLLLAFPDRSAEWREEVLCKAAGTLGELFGEVVWLWSASRRRVLAKTRFEGLEHLTGSLAPKQGSILITGHCGNWEWMNLALGAVGVPMTVAAREIYDPRLDVIARRLRGRFGGATELRGEGAGRRLAQALRRGRVIGLLIDQDIDAPGVFVEFFGHPAWTPSGAAVLALRTGAPLVVGFARRQADGTMLVALDPPLTTPATGDLRRDAAQLTALLTSRIEAQVRSCPEQWVWMHRRWQRQPLEGEQVWCCPRCGAETGSARAPADVGVPPLEPLENP